jgi:hypothetical protein
VTCSERDTIAPHRSSGPQRLQLLPLEPRLGAQIFDAGRTRSGQVIQQPAPAAVRGAHSGDLRAADRVEQPRPSPDTSRLLPRCTATITWPHSPSSPNHGHLVVGQVANPGLPAWYGSSWHAWYKLGSAQSAVRVSSPRAAV